ncbi:MAG: hypothetical protein ABS62_03550 [Microbacterium sp. SCN 70-200]|uniref:hypothetical protein n=1 Tax=unclassified Microbacterium TaxID=2609290 RepID=UPI00086F5132|nr:MULTISPECIES: hypothetical protein [unclassified Microbacterium]MBN9213943.1 hypothetical protein [Microbacterium sp.]ODT42480.1 MAG: hypothetical protein ABS62_03550 [Microbacterium sp. SCN 70-200]OJV85391.1 MAG: hypothetical protein BGO46_08715 [Microbacterium sp. 70-16]
MVTASISFPAAARPTARRTPLRERVSAGGAAVLSIGGTIVAIGIALLGLLVVPIAAAIVFGPALLAQF